MTETETKVRSSAAELIERNRVERETLRAYYVAQSAEAKRRQAERLAALPKLPRAAAAPPFRKGVGYVRSDRRAEAVDPATGLAYLATTLGAWVEADRAKALGIPGAPVVMSP